METRKTWANRDWARAALVVILSTGIAVTMIVVVSHTYSPVYVITALFGASAMQLHHTTRQSR